MKYRIISFITVLILLVIGWYYLDALIINHAWATLDGEQWKLKAQGWELLYQAWPVAAGGTLLGAVVCLFGLALLFSQMTDKDHEATVNRLTQAKDKALANAASAEQRAEQKQQDRKQALDEQAHALKNKEAQLNQFHEKSKQYALQCQQEVIDAKAQAEEATRLAEHAHKKKKNAAGAAERRKRKLARINQ